MTWTHSREPVPNIERHVIENLNLSLEMPMEVSVGSVSDNLLSSCRHTNARNHDSNNYYSNHLLNFFDSSLEYDISSDTSSLYCESPLSSPLSQRSSHTDNSDNLGNFDNNGNPLVGTELDIICGSILQNVFNLRRLFRLRIGRGSPRSIYMPPDFDFRHR